MRHSLKLLLPLLFCWQFLPAQLLINEYSASNKQADADGFGEYEDWVELYNSSGASLSTAGFYLTDNPTNPTKWGLPVVTLPAGGRMLVWCSSRDITFGASYHSNFKLTQCKGEVLQVYNASLAIVDSLTLQLTQEDHSRGRTSDGAGTWGIFTDPSPGLPNSGASTAYEARPTFSVAPGFYTGSVSLSISGAGILKYTLDGTEPTLASPLTYSAPLTLTAGHHMVRVRAFNPAPGMLPSFTETNSYFVDVDNHGLAVVSVASDEFDDLFSSFSDEIRSSFEYFDTTGLFQHEGDGDFRSHGNDSWAFPQKGIRFYARDDYGYANNIEFPLFNATPRDEFDVIILKAGASDNYPFANSFYGLHSAHLRDVYAQTLSQKHNLHLDERSWEPCQLYINGQYWGLYEIRERIDADYADYYYDQDPDSVDMLAYWGGLTLDEGSDTAWNALYTYMTTHDLSIPANYDYVDERFDVRSLIDYFILNTYLVNTDWLNWNTAWWRGRSTPGVKWRYRLWDEDNILNLGENYTGVSTSGYTLDPCEPTDLFPGDPDIPHTDMINALDANPDFHNLYITRYADLLNTAFHCDTLHAHLDWILSRIAPEMPNQTARWGGSVAGWNEDLDSVRVQIEGRCMVVDSLMKGCYSLTGPYNILVNVMPPLSGDVQVNTIVPAAYPWSADYFGSTTMQFTALPAPGYKLDHWDFANHTPTPTYISDTVEISFTMADTVTAYFIDTALTATPDPNGTHAWMAYPVPASETLYLEWDLSHGQLLQADLLSVTGTTVRVIHEGLADAGAHRQALDVSRLPAGVYVLRMAGEGWRETKKVVVTR